MYIFNNFLDFPHNLARFGSRDKTTAPFFLNSNLLFVGIIIFVLRGKKRFDEHWVFL
jgi:hypothetical protein